MVDPELPSRAVGPRRDADSAGGPSARKKYRLSVRVMAVALIVLVLAGMLEGGARLVYDRQEQIRSLPLFSALALTGLDLEPYKMPSPRWPGHWVLRPGYQATIQQLLEHKLHANRTRGVQAIEAALGNPNHESQAILHINKDGFKGPELDQSHSRTRVLMLGDSITFGIGVVDYPRTTEKKLHKRGIAVEVINGGVEGYLPHDVLLEMDRYKAVKPAIATLYIGWNALYKQTPWPDSWENKLRLTWLAISAYRALQTRLDSVAYARSLLGRTPMPDSHLPEVKSLESYDPPFMDEIEKIVDEMAAAGADVVLVTLPGLFSLSERPTPRALAIGHLPQFTNNPFVLAMLTDRYNAALRKLAHHRGLGIIDLEKWSVDALRPRDAYFMDSVHLSAQSLELIGAFMAEQLAPRIEGLQKRKSGAENR